MTLRPLFKGRLQALLVFGLVPLCVLAWSVPASAAPMTIGDVFVSIGNGRVEEFTPSGAPVATLDTGTASNETTGSAFDAAANFYVTDFSANTLTKFDAAGANPATFGSGFNSNPESVVFDRAGNAYVGQAGGNAQILKFDASGALLASYSPAPESRGTDFVDLASDQCTIHYTSEGTSVRTFNVCTNTQGPVFASGLPGTAFAHRILPSGGELVADSDRVVRLDAAGAVAQTYTFPNPGLLFALNLDPNGTSFWTADLRTGEVFEVDIATGHFQQQWNAKPNTDVAGLTVKGEITAAGGGFTGSSGPPTPPPRTPSSTRFANPPKVYLPDKPQQQVQGESSTGGPTTLTTTSVRVKQNSTIVVNTDVPGKGELDGTATIVGGGGPKQNEGTPGVVGAVIARSRTYGTGRVSTSGPGQVGLAIHPNRAARAMLRRKGHLTVAVHLAFRASGRLGGSTKTKDLRVKVGSRKHH